MRQDHAPPEPAGEPGIPGDCPVQTARGPRPLHGLEPGTRLITRAGMRRLVELAPAPPAAIGIEIAPDAFGPGLPDAPLRLHPGQRLRLPRCLGGGPACAGALINGSSIRVGHFPENGLMQPLLDGPGDLYAAGIYLCLAPALAVI